ncbi:LCP family protein [Treponema pallidum]|nr:LCP family protein [Treponema pallidum]QUL24068.1 LCP family protein [Treponema pallidum]QUL26963.1 LCP family protein [Treponema pallidum]QUL27931.1 LCP family protein [Treponema pallidum]
MKVLDMGRHGLFLLLIFFMLVITVFAVFFGMKRDPLESSLSSDNILKVLFVIEHENVPISSNVVAYYPATRRAAMFDIPHNMGLILQSLGRTDGIGSLYSERGIEEYKREVEKLTGINVPFSVVCSLDNFSKLTDLLSGLSVFIPTPIDVHTERAGHVLLPSGSVSLDGDKMRDYLLYEDEDEGEGESASRKQKAILALLRSVNDHSEFFVHSTRAFSLNRLIRSNVRRADLKKLIGELSKLDSERLVPQRFSGTKRVVDGKVLLFPSRDGQQIKEIVRQTLAVLASENGTAFGRVYALEILNGTESHGLARTTANIYQGFGYDVVRVDNALEQSVQKTVLVDRIGNPAVAKVVAQVIRCQNIETTSASLDEYGVETGIDFTLILGKDFNGYLVKEGT